MADSSESHEIGYGKPPRETRFVKGKSGNPKGRPKGSQNLATILAKVARERVRVNGSGGRTISKLEATLTQLCSQAASGNLRAIRELLYWTKFLQDSEQGSAAVPGSDERDKAVMASILERIRQSEVGPPEEEEGAATEALPSGVQ